MTARPRSVQDMKLLSWNVNGIRAVLKKGFVDFVKAARPDVLCLQETRGYAPEIDDLLPGYDMYWSHAEKKGYSGTAIFSKNAGAKLKAKKPAKFPVLGVSYGIGRKEFDDEGRVTTAEYADFYLVNVYTPNAGEGLKRLEYRQAWDVAFLKFMKKLEKMKPVIVCGDLNVAHTEIDLKNPKSNANKSAGFTDQEREGMTRIIKAGFIDSFRHFHPGEEGHYSWWSYRMGARARNVGWRIDYFCVSEKLGPRLKKAMILKDQMGSDHCPVGIVLKDS